MEKRVKDRKNRLLAVILKTFGYHVTICSTSGDVIPFIKVSAYGNPNHDEPKGH